MSPSSNPILLSLAKPLPHNAPTKILIESGAPLRDIAGQAKVEWTCLATHVQNPLGKDERPGWLKENGYAEWLKDADQEDRTRMLGWLNMIHDMARDLAEEEEGGPDDED